MQNIQLSLWQVAVGVVLLVGVSYFLFSGAPVNPLSPEANQETVGQNNEEVVVSPTSTPTSTTQGAVSQKPVTTTPKPTAPTLNASIKLATPSQGEVWAIGQAHTIHWTKESGYTGGVYLVDATTKETVGWILTNTGPKQNSVSWNTRDLLISRTGAEKKNVLPGNYMVRVMFDAKIGEVLSAPFTIVASGAESVVPVVRFKDFSITPGSVSVSRGAKVIFINNDTTPHIITAQGLTTFVVPAFGYYTLETSSLAPNTYYYSSSVYTYRAKGNIVIR